MLSSPRPRLEDAALQNMSSPSHDVSRAETLDEALQRAAALEAELSCLRREHERTTSKLSQLLKKRSPGDDPTETEASLELSQLRQQVAVLQWREQQYKQIIAKSMARSAAAFPRRHQLQSHARLLSHAGRSL